MDGIVCTLCRVNLECPTYVWGFGGVCPSCHVIIMKRRDREQITEKEAGQRFQAEIQEDQERLWQRTFTDH